MGVLEDIWEIVWEAMSICILACRLQMYLCGPHVVVCALQSPHHNHTLCLVYLRLASPPYHPLPPMVTTATTSNFPHVGSWGYFPIRIWGMWCWL